MKGKQQMKKFLLATALATAFFTGHAFSTVHNSMPSQFIGDWCQTKTEPNEGATLFYYILGDCTHGGGELPFSTMTVRKDGFSMNEEDGATTCKIIESWWRRVWSFQLKVRCSYQGETSIIKYHIMPQIILTKFRD
jgi:hypothetical protein